MNKQKLFYKNVYLMTKTRQFILKITFLVFRFNSKEKKQFYKTINYKILNIELIHTLKDKRKDW